MCHFTFEPNQSQDILTSACSHNWRNCLKATPRKAVRFGYELIRRGVFCAPGGKIYLSLAHSDDDLQQTLQRIEQVLSAARD